MSSLDSCVPGAQSVDREAHLIFAALAQQLSCGDIHSYHGNKSEDDGNDGTDG